MKTNLKASVYANMVELDGNLVSLSSSGSYTFIAKVGANSSLMSSTVQLSTLQLIPDTGIMR